MPSLLPSALQPFAIPAAFVFSVAISFLWHMRKGIDAQRSLALGAVKAAIVVAAAFVIASCLR